MYNMYNLGIAIMAFVIRLAALFHKKARLMVRGQRTTFRRLREAIDRKGEHIWVHAASLGEFEQARPLIETIRKDFPRYRILLTFFSPSGYEVRKEYPLADSVCYLPFDTKRNARHFLELAHPRMAIFIKYEFWYNYVHECYRRQIPLFLASAVFRPGQPFFKKWKSSYGRMLRFYTRFFVQDKASAQLLRQHGYHNVTITGDTRIDRVIEVRKQQKHLPVVASFAGEMAVVLVAGSSWLPDEEILIDYFNRTPRLKLIIAPHEIDEARLLEIEHRLQRPSLRYSRASEATATEAECLIIDCFGILSSVYAAGHIAYIGGGFGIGIHNLSEAAVYGMPVIFGPKYDKFREAHGLIHAGGGFPIHDKKGFEKVMDAFLHDPNTLRSAGEKAGAYIRKNGGATQKVIRELPLS